MVDDRPEDTGPAPDPGRAKRAPPTIDLEATEVSGDTQECRRRRAGAEPEPSAPRPPAARDFRRHRSRRSPAPVAAALVIGVAWFAGWPARRSAGAAPPRRRSMPPRSTISPRASPASSPRSASPPPPAPDPAAAARVEALEKSLAALRGELAAQRAQSEKLAAASTT